MADGELILVAGALLAAGILVSLAAGHLRVPGLVLFLGLGMAVGTDGAGLIDFNDYDLARTVGVIALAFILFEGGLAAGYEEIRPVLAPAVSLAIVATVATAVMAGLAAAQLFGLSTLEGLLLGSILAATDGAAVFAVLRGSTLRRRLARTLEGEAGLNDPVAVLLVLGFIAWIEDPEYGIPDLLLLFGQQLGIGLLVGGAVGWLAVGGLKRARLASAGLYPVASIAAAALAFGAAESLHGSGFLAVYLAGLALGSSSLPAKRTIVTFHDGLAWVAQLAMFLTLGLLVFPSQLPEVALKGTVLAVVVILARPIAVALAISLFRYSPREQLVLGWAGLRGAVPVVLATFPVIEGVPGSLEFFNVVFFAVLLSTVLQGTTFQPLARLLGVTSNEAALPLPLVETGAMRRLGAEIVEYPVDPADAIVGCRVRDLGLPRDALLNLVVRGNQAIPPRGSTQIDAGDHLHVLVRQEVAIEFSSILERWRAGPVGPTPRAVTKRPRAERPASTVGAWRDEFGDPGHPASLVGLDVVEQLRTRRDGVPGALVLLEDGRYGFTGPAFAVGSPATVQAAARRHLQRSPSDLEGAWWREVIGALAR